jgi:hypothetical protein
VAPLEQLERKIPAPHVVNRKRTLWDDRAEPHASTFLTGATSRGASDVAL